MKMQLFDLGLIMAQQFGTEKKTATTAPVLTAPYLEVVEVKKTEDGTDVETTYTLKHTPKVTPTEIYEINGDSALGAKYELSTSSGYSYSDGKITLPVTLDDVGKEYFVMYEYDSEMTGDNDDSI